nr:hypothetical protein [uncultured Neisseria sp.]
MSNISRQQQADLAVDAYNYQAVTEGDNKITIGGHDYKVLAVRNNPVTDY